MLGTLLLFLPLSVGNPDTVGMMNTVMYSGQVMDAAHLVWFNNQSPDTVTVDSIILIDALPPGQSLKFYFSTGKPASEGQINYYLTADSGRAYGKAAIPPYSKFTCSFGGVSFFKGEPPTEMTAYTAQDADAVCLRLAFYYESYRDTLTIANYKIEPVSVRPAVRHRFAVAGKETFSVVDLNGRMLPSAATDSGKKNGSKTSRARIQRRYIANKTE